VTRAVFVLNGARTAFMRAGTDFLTVSAVDLGRAASVEAMARSGVEPGAIDQAIFGNIATPVDAANIARVIAMKAGVPKEKPAHSVSRNCASGIESVVEAARLIQTGEADVVLAGGVENMTQIPFLYRDSVKAVFAKAGMAKSAGDRVGALSKMPWKELFNPVIGLKEGLNDPVCDMGMGDTAEILAKEGHLSREVQDQFALRSHLRAAAARARFAEEITPVPLPPDFDRLALADNGIREGQTLEALGKLKPYFDRRFGTVTAGNSSQITDGGAAVVVASEEYVKAHGLTPLGRIASWGFVGLEPERMGLGPSRSTPLALKRAGLSSMKEIGLVEMNEAFAVQVLANLTAFAADPQLGPIDEEILNVNGGAIALGHPVGCSGTRLILTLLLEMRRRRVKNGLATLCVGGGQGASIILEAA
jgi:acetyl-CoA acyltransferase